MKHNIFFSWSVCASVQYIYLSHEESVQFSNLLHICIISTLLKIQHSHHYVMQFYESIVVLRWNWASAISPPSSIFIFFSIVHVTLAIRYNVNKTIEYYFYYNKFTFYFTFISLIMSNGPCTMNSFIIGEANFWNIYCQRTLLRNIFHRKDCFTNFVQSLSVRAIYWRVYLKIYFN